LAELTEKVYTIEIIEVIAMRAKKLLESLGYKNIEFKIGDGYLGWKEYAPYDVIIVTCGPNDIPPSLVEQLAEGGRMVIPVGSWYQTLTILDKIKGELKKTESISCRFVPMTRKFGKN
jgi:protein-L-isoaspartate(D-aspartate) O-methyltransferase